MTAVHAQHEIGKGVKRPAGNLVAAAVDQQTGAADHLLGGAPGESEQEDRARIDALIDQMGDAVDQRASLAGAGAGDDQQRPLDRGRRLVLRLV